MRGIIAVLNAYLSLSIEGWAAAETLGLAKFCGNQHNPDWKWVVKDVGNIKLVLRLYLEYGELR